MIKRFIAVMIIVAVMVAVGSVMFGNASALPGFPEVRGEQLYAGEIDENRIYAEVYKVTEDSYRVQFLYTQKGMREAFVFDGKVKGCQIDIVVDKAAMTELMDGFSDLREIEL